MKAIPIRIHPLFWVMAGIIGWINSQHFYPTLLWMGVIFVSVLIHELGHALSSRYFGQTASIQLIAFGGLTRHTGKKLKLWQDFIVVLCGPLFGFLLFLFSYTVLTNFNESLSQVVRYVLNVSILINLFWTIINLFPVQPLDGGHLLRITLQGVFGFKGLRISVLFSLIFCVILGLTLFATGMMLGGAIFFLLGFENYRSWSGMKEMTEEDQDESFVQQLTLADTAMKVGDLDKAWAILIEFRSRIKEGVLKNVSSQMMAAILLTKKQYREAYEMIDPIFSKLSEDFITTAHQIAYKSDHIEEAIQLGNQAYQASPTYQVAITNAYCYAKKGEAKPTIGWLQRAYNDGLPNLQETLQNSIFDKIRSDPAFLELEREQNSLG